MVRATPFPGRGKRRWDETKVAQLERKVGQQALEIDFLKGCLQRIEEAADAAGTDWQAATCRHIQSQIEKGVTMTVSRMCELGQVSRAGLLSVRAGRRTRGRRSGSAGRDPADRSGVSLLWPAADHSRTEAARMGGESQAGRPHHARG